MINVLVVDDDNLVRRGLISAMPWSRFDMQVIGEASNGEMALEFMENHSVELLMTDLSMPVMSGLELMKATKERFPEVFMIVLTLHQDFEFVQEALRLGAIDYIAKIQLEREHFEEVLGRIHSRLLHERGKGVDTISSNHRLDTFVSDVGYIIYSSLEQADTQWEQAMLGTGEWIEIYGNCWFWQPDAVKANNEVLKRIPTPRDWMIVKVEGLQGRERSDVFRILRRDSHKHFFYLDAIENDMITAHMDNMDKAPIVMNEEVLAAQMSEWLNFNWMRDNSLLRQLLQELKALQLSVPRLSRFMMEISSEWNKCYSSAVSSNASMPGPFMHWNECEGWFINLKKSVSDEIGSQYSKEVVNCIMVAVRIVHEELGQQVFAVDVAKRVNMSRSYFNQCFKDIVGRSFNEFVQQARIEKAKEYLMRTNRPIVWISEQIGYSDDKYFSRLFREQTGKTPSEFRRGEQ